MVTAECEPHQQTATENKLNVRKRNYACVRSKRRGSVCVNRYLTVLKLGQERKKRSRGGVGVALIDI